jgi:hypothetical protein
VKQTEIPGTETPSVPIVAEALDAMFAAKRDQKAAAETTKLRTDVLLMHMAENGLTSHPYIDEKTGKKKLFVVKREPKGVSINAPKVPKRNGKAEPPGEEVEAKKAKAKADKEANAVEHKKRSRSSVKAELAERDAKVKADEEAERTAADPLAQAQAATDDSWGAPRRSEDDEDDVDPRPVPSDFPEEDPDDTRDAVTVSRGQRVKFKHQQGLPETHLVVFVTAEGMVELDDMAGQFASHLFVVADDPATDDEDPRPQFLRDKTAARDAKPSLLEEAEARQDAGANGAADTTATDEKPSGARNGAGKGKTRGAKPGRCTSAISGGQIVCALDAGHNGAHTSAKPGRKHAQHATWEPAEGGKVAVQTYSSGKRASGWTEDGAAGSS